MEAGKPKIKAPAPCDSQLTVFSLCPHVTEGVGECSGVPSLRAVTLFRRALSSWSHHFSKAPRTNTVIILVLRFQHTNLWKTKTFSWEQAVSVI